MIPISDKNRVESFELLALGEMLPQYDGLRLAEETLRERGNVESLMRKIAAKVRAEPMSKAADRILGFDAAQETGGYSLSRALRAAYDRSWHEAGLERSISDLVTTKTGKVPNGFFVPLSILARAFSAGTPGEAGNLIAPAVAGELTVDPLRKFSALSRLGCTYLTGLDQTLEIPRFNYANDAAFLSEVAPSVQLLESTSQTVLTPKRIGVSMSPTRQALFQASRSALDVTLGRHLVKGIFEQVEVMALNGDGTNNTPSGLRFTPGVGSVAGGADGAQLNFAHLCDLENLPGLSNVDDGEFSGYVLNSQTRRWLRTAQRAAGLPYIWEGGERPLLGHRAAVTQLMPNALAKGASGAVCSALAYSGDWSQMIVGLYGAGVDVIVDRVTAAGDGIVKITANLYVGIGFAKPAAFSVMSDAKTS